jgi:hypothetical protein
MSLRGIDVSLYKDFSTVSCDPSLVCAYKKLTAAKSKSNVRVFLTILVSSLNKKLVEFFDVEI